MAEEKTTGFTTREALFYHETIRPGKIEIIASKPMATQRDLSLAYSPGVAAPVEAIAADPANAAHVAAPMPGVVASIGVTAGQQVKQGDLILTIEAMKMETGLHADRDGAIKAVHVTPGAQIDAKDLLVEYEA